MCNAFLSLDKICKQLHREYIKFMNHDPEVCAILQTRTSLLTSSISIVACCRQKQPMHCYRLNTIYRVSIAPCNRQQEHTHHQHGLSWKCYNIHAFAFHKNQYSVSRFTRHLCTNFSFLIGTWDHYKAECISHKNTQQCES